MNSDYEYRNERVIGHSIRASEAEQSALSATIDDIAEAYGIENAQYNELIEITEGDVDWDEPKTIRLSRKEITDLAERFGVPYGSN